MVLESIEVSERQQNQNASIWSRMSLIHLSIIMLIIAASWRVVDVFILGLGNTWINILPSKLFPLLIIIGIFWRFRNEETKPILGLSSTMLRPHLAMGLIIAISLFFSVDVGGPLLYASLFDPSYSMALNVVFLDYIWYVFLFMFVNAIFEETLFRGLLQNAFKTHTTPNRAIILSAIFFGIWHVVWPLASSMEGGNATEAIALVVMTGIFGGLFGVYYERFSSGKTLSGPILAHALLNFFNECFKFGPDPSVEGPDFSFQSPILMALTLLMYLGAFIVLLIIAWRFKIEQVQTFWLHLRTKLSRHFKVWNKLWEFKSKVKDNSLSSG